MKTFDRNWFLLLDFFACDGQHKNSKATDYFKYLLNEDERRREITGSRGDCEIYIGLRCFISVPSDGEAMEFLRFIVHWICFLFMQIISKWTTKKLREESSRWLRVLGMIHVRRHNNRNELKLWLFTVDYKSIIIETLQNIAGVDWNVIKIETKEKFHCKFWFSRILLRSFTAKTNSAVNESTQSNKKNSLLFVLFQNSIKH